MLGLTKATAFRSLFKKGFLIVWHRNIFNIRHPEKLSFACAQGGFPSMLRAGLALQGFADDEIKLFCTFRAIHLSLLRPIDKFGFLWKTDLEN